MRIVLQPKVSITAAQFTAASGVFDNVNDKQFGSINPKKLTAVLHVTDADRTDTDETYDVYVTSFITLPTAGRVVRWDIVHFPQIAADPATAVTYVAHVSPFGPQPQNVTTAGPGVMAVQTATNLTFVAGSDQGIRTLGAGLVLHGALGEGLSFSLVGGGTTPGPFEFELFVDVQE
jgi:hypothetical protein